MTVVYAFMVGDLFHIGHLKALQQAKALGDYLIVGVITDEGVTAYKRQPIIPLKERLEIIRNIKCVDEVIVQEGLDPTPNLMRYKPSAVPDILVHGDDWSEDFPGSDYMKSIGKLAVRTKYWLDQSTTKIIKEIVGGCS